jgi:hypothetical protein
LAYLIAFLVDFWFCRPWLYVFQKGKIIFAYFSSSMKVLDKIKAAEQEGRCAWSFEYFPPKTAQGVQNLYDRMERYVLSPLHSYSQIRVTACTRLVPNLLM